MLLIEMQKKTDSSSFAGNDGTLNKGFDIHKLQLIGDQNCSISMQ